MAKVSLIIWESFSCRFKSVISALSNNRNYWLLWPCPGFVVSVAFLSWKMNDHYKMQVQGTVICFLLVHASFIISFDKFQTQLPSTLYYYHALHHGKYQGFVRFVLQLLCLLWGITLHSNKNTRAKTTNPCCVFCF